MGKKVSSVLIDADILIYRAASFTDDSFDGEPIVSVKQALAFYSAMRDRWLRLARESFDFEGYTEVFSKGRSFRKSLNPDYKANRKAIKPHPSLFPLKDALVDSIGNLLMIDGLEADDVIGLYSKPEDTLVISADKDFKTLPGNLFIPASHGQTKGSLHFITPDEADRNWMLQALTGDVIDNYKGLPGIGVKKAEKILPENASVDILWPKVLSAYLTKGLTYDHALVNARMARILRDGDYNFSSKEVRLWTPKGQPEVWMEATLDKSKKEADND